MLFLYILVLSFLINRKYDLAKHLAAKYTNTNAIIRSSQLCGTEDEYPFASLIVAASSARHSAACVVEEK